MFEVSAEADASLKATFPYIHGSRVAPICSVRIVRDC